MLWKIKKACEGEGPVWVTVAFGSGGSFSSLSTIRLLVTCSQLDLDVFALLSFYGPSNHCPLSYTSRTGIKAIKHSSEIHFHVSGFSFMASLS